jgi:UDP-N-acetyl-D-mannosaminuronic acid dehydrogenase
MTAEVSKVVENAYRDVNIAFANEVALICESLGVDVFEVRDLVNNLPNDPSNPATNPVRNMHIPGAGVGGHCLPKDSWLLKYGVDNFGYTRAGSKVIASSREVNSYMPVHMADLAIQALGENGVPLSKATVAVLGYAFLENSDDTRNTPAVPLIRELNKRGIKRISIHDPYVRVEELPEVEKNLHKVIMDADCLCLVTAHREYREIPWNKIAERNRRLAIVDGRNVFDREKLRLLGIRCRTVGKGERNEH